MEKKKKTILTIEIDEEGFFEIVDQYCLEDDDHSKNIYWLSKNGDDERGTPFKTIQAAIDKSIEDEAKETRIVITSDDNFDNNDGRTCYFEDENAK
jgi:hypothetical protein